MAKTKKPSLNKLQIAQLVDCVNNGMTYNPVPKREGQPKAAPLFFPEIEQPKLF
jgi:hypothetical protein